MSSSDSSSELCDEFISMCYSCSPDSEGLISEAHAASSSSLRTGLAVLLRRATSELANSPVRLEQWMAMFGTLLTVISFEDVASVWISLLHVNAAPECELLIKAIQSANICIDTSIDIRGTSLLDVTILSGNIFAIRLLTSADASLTRLSPATGLSPIGLAITTHSPALDLLLSFLPLPPTPTPAPNHPLHPLHPTWRELSGGMTLLMLAAERGNADAIAALLKAGADPSVGARGLVPVVNAVFGRSEPCLRLLLDAGASPDQPTRHGLTPLTHATHRHWPEGVRALLAAGADPERRDSYGLRAVDAAAEAVREARAQAKAVGIDVNKIAERKENVADDNLENIDDSSVFENEDTKKSRIQQQKVREALKTLKEAQEVHEILVDASKKRISPFFVVVTSVFAILAAGVAHIMYILNKQ